MRKVNPGEVQCQNCTTISNIILKNEISTTDTQSAICPQCDLKIGEVQTPYKIVVRSLDLNGNYV